MTLWQSIYRNSEFEEAPRKALLLVASILSAWVLLSAGAAGQGLLDSGSSQSSSTQSSIGQDTSAASVAFGDSLASPEENSDSASATNSNASTPGLGVVATSLPADKILQILEESPDLVVEVKSAVAERMQQQGAQVDANDISDEMLYNQIQTNDAVRANVTTFLRARGYVSQDDMESAAFSANTGQGAMPLPQSSMTFSGGANTGRLSAGAGVGTGLSSLGRNSYEGLSGRPLDAVSNREGGPGGRTNQQTNASTDIPKVLRSPTPYNLRSMRDLYTQIPEQTASLKRFGSDVFMNRDFSAMSRGSGAGNIPLDVPIGPDYVLGAGDTLRIDLWGGVTQSITRTVGRDGRLLLPEAGSLQIEGLALGQASSLIEAALKSQFRNAQVSVTLSGLRSVRIYVVGDVQRPGGYDISSLATPLSALYAAGGPTSVGSLRIVRHYRGQQLLEDVDLYDFLLHGMKKVNSHFESGDTLLVPPAGPQIAVSGAVRRPAIYELKPGESRLATVIDDAGGFTAAAALGQITIERIDADSGRETVKLDAGQGQDMQAEKAAIEKFDVKDGDRIEVSPILPYSKRAIYLQGHVVRPGRFSYTDGMRLSDVLRSDQDLLPEPATRGEIVRLVPPDLHAETIGFDVADVLIGNANVTLQPFDTIRIFGRYQVDMPKVTVSGEVLRPGVYPLSKNMTAGQLVRMAGGFKRDALLENADLTSYTVENGNMVVGNLVTVPIGVAVAGTNPSADVSLKPGDTLTIHQITGWSDIGQSVMIAGQVRFPGSYGFREGEHLSSVLRRAGGFRDTAYTEGSVLVREQVRELEEKSREELIRQIETNSASARLGPALGSGDSGNTLQLIKAQQEQAVQQLQSHAASGRMVIHISADIDSWANTPADLELHRGDVLTVPKQPGFVLVTGQVYNATALTFTPGKTAAWYLSHAGGVNSTANRKEIFVIRANGSLVGHHSEGWFGGDVLSTRLNPGDVVVVPQKIIGGSLLWRNLLTTAQLASSIAITAGIAVAAL